MKNILHSCGNVTELIPLLIEVGLDCLQPIEVKAGMDIISLKENYGDRLSFMGGIDVRLMAEAGPEAIEEEIRIKFEAAKKNGGYIYHSDHSIPKNVSFSQYCRVIELVKKYGTSRIPETMKKEAVSEPPAESREARKGKAGRERKEGDNGPGDALKETPAEENPKPVKNPDSSAGSRAKRRIRLEPEPKRGKGRKVEG